MEPELESSALPVTAVICLLATEGPQHVSSERCLPESHPGINSLAVCLPPSQGVIWPTAESVLLLSGTPSVLSTSRSNSRDLLQVSDVS